MKIRHPLIVKMLGFAAACLVRVWFGLVRHRHRSTGKNLDHHLRGFRGRYLYAFWHEYLLMPAYIHAGDNVHVLVSHHADGELIAQTLRWLGYPLVRGSTGRGGVEAVRHMVRQVQSGRAKHLAVIPDGPRGPRRRVQPGVVYVAARSGLPILPMSYGLQRPWRMRSWDRFALPRPGSTTFWVTMEPICVPANATKEQLESYRLRVEEALHRADELAERLVGNATRTDDDAGIRAAA